MSTRRITFFMHDLSGGGVERMRLALIAELRTRGLDVSLVVNRLRGPLLALLPADLPVHELETSRMLAAVWPLARYLRRKRPEVLIASLDHNNITALLAQIVARVPTAIVICQHNALSAERPLGWRYRVVPWCYWTLQSRADGIVAVSDGVADDLAGVARIPRHRITAIYNPVIDNAFSERAVGPPPHAWFVDHVSPVFVFAGRLIHQKDPVTLLNAMALLLRSRPARLIVLGEGPLRVELELQASRLQIANKVAFVGFQSNPLPWIRYATALLSTSRYEGLGNTIIEALACGTPVVATDCPHGPSEVLLGGKVGTLVPVGDVPALVCAMRAVIDAPRNEVISTARAASFTAKTCADKHLALIEKLDERSPVRALGLRLSPLRADQVLDHVIHGEIDDVGAQLVVTPNLDHVRLLRNKAFAVAYDAARFVCPDGFPILLYARLRGLRLSARVTGCDLFHRLASHPGLVRHRLCIVVESAQTKAAVLARAAEGRLPPNVSVLIAQQGLADSPETQLDLAMQIQKVCPTILVLTLGAPLSEVFVHTHRLTLGRCWALCVGQAVRVEFGLTARAPDLWRQLGLEWVWRIRQEPRRLAARYVKALVWFPVAVARDIKCRLPTIRTNIIAMQVRPPRPGRMLAWPQVRPRRTDR